MKVICINAWGGKLHAPLMRYVANETPDVLCVQEVTHTPMSDKDWLIYRDDDRMLDQRANLLRDLRSILPDHQVTFAPTAQGTLVDGEDTVPSQWGLATFTHPNLVVIAQTQGFVFKDYDPTEFGQFPRSRTGHVERVWDHDAGRGVTIAQMHGMRDPRGKIDTPERQEQVQRFIEMIKVTATPGELLIVCGDFNVEPDSATLTKLKSLGLTELVTTHGFTSTRSSHYSKPGRFADYMLVSDPDQVIRFDVVSDPEVSDHCPLKLEI